MNLSKKFKCDLSSIQFTNQIYNYILYLFYTMIYMALQEREINLGHGLIFVLKLKSNNTLRTHLGSQQCMIYHPYLRTRLQAVCQYKQTTHNLTTQMLNDATQTRKRNLSNGLMKLPKRLNA